MFLPRPHLAKCSKSSTTRERDGARRERKDPLTARPSVQNRMKSRKCFSVLYIFSTLARLTFQGSNVYEWVKFLLSHKSKTGVKSRWQRTSLEKGCHLSQIKTKCSEKDNYLWTVRSWDFFWTEKCKSLLKVSKFFTIFSHLECVTKNREIQIKIFSHLERLQQFWMKERLIGKAI